MSNVDITQLAIDRETTDSNLMVRRNIVSRYVIPGTIVFGFCCLIAWAAWDILIPPRDVKVVPVISVSSNSRVEGTPLFNAAGWIEPRPTAIRVAALAPGVVEKLLVVEDQVVKKGEAVAELIKEDAQLIFERAVADRQLAEAELKKADAFLAAANIRLRQPVHLEAVLAEAKASLAKTQTLLKNLEFETERALSRLDLAKKNHKRNLDAGSSVSQKELDVSLTALDTSQALVHELNEREASLKAEQTALDAQAEALATQLKLLTDENQAVGEGEAQVNAAKAKVDQRRVVEAEAKLMLSRMTIRAPVDGRVYQLVGLPGSRVGTGVMTAMETHDSSSIVTMYQPESLQIRVDVRFEDIPKVSLEQTVQINNPALKDPIPGKVLFISSEADIQKNTLQVKVSIEDPPDFFKPEMLVDVTFLAAASKTGAPVQQERIFIQRSFVQSDDSGDFVWIADQSEGVARKSRITTGSSNGPLVEIAKGIRNDQRIISSGTEGLVDGTRIRILGEEPSSD